MIVKIGESEFNSQRVEIKIQLSDREKLQIQKMPVEHDTYEPDMMQILETEPVIMR